MDGNMVDGQWFSTDELAKLIGVDSSTLRRWRTSKPAQGPAFVRFTSKVTKYSARDVETWLRAHRIDPNRTV